MPQQPRFLCTKLAIWNYISANSAIGWNTDMASELGVQTIQHTNGTDAITVGSTGIITQPKMPFFMIDRCGRTALHQRADSDPEQMMFSHDPDTFWVIIDTYRLTVDANTKGYLVA